MNLEPNLSIPTMRRSSSDVSRIVLLLMSLVGIPVACDEACPQTDGAGSDDFGLSLLQTNLGMSSELKATRIVDSQFGEAPAGAQNLCIMSPETGTLHLAPEWLLIGVQKGATSSFSQMFTQHPQVVSPQIHYPEPSFFKKELHIFDDGKRFDRGKDFWLNHYPKCSRNTRLVAHESTPGYTLKATYMPIAANIKSYYQESSPLIKFGIILREPLARIHSAFYQERLCTLTHKAISFQKYVARMLNGSDPCDLLTGGTDYPNQLQSYFDEFSPSQFTIYTFKDIVSPKGPAHVAALWRQLGLQDTVLPKDMDSNSAPHPSLEDDLDNKTLVSLKALIARTVDADKVARVLTEQAEKPIFAGYNGSGGMDSVAEWLGNSW